MDDGPKVARLPARLAFETDVPALRRLVNAAYRVLGEMGLNYTGVFQDEEITRQRMRGREVYILEDEGVLVGTVTFSVEEEDGERYGYVNQLAVEPSRQRQGLGGRLMDIAEERARDLGLRSVRLDTALPAHHLVRWYAARGYVEIGRTRWSGKTYESVIPEKSL